MYPIVSKVSLKDALAPAPRRKAVKIRLGSNQSIGPKDRGAVIPPSNIATRLATLKELITPTLSFVTTRATDTCTLLVPRPVTVTLPSPSAKVTVVSEVPSISTLSPTTSREMPVMVLLAGGGGPSARRISVCN